MNEPTAAPAPAAAQGLTLRQREGIACYLFISPAIAFLVFMAIGPMVASLILSFTYWDILTPPVWIGLQNYREMFFEDRLFWTSLWNTVYFVLIVVPIGTFFPLFIALLLNTKARGQAVFRTCFYLPSIVPVVASSTLWLWMFNTQFGLINSALERLGIEGPGWMSDPFWSKPGIIIVTIWGMVGGPSMLIYLAGLQGVPVSLYEAAEIDGATKWQKFRHITLPLMSPYILFTAIMGFIGGFQVFTQAFVMTRRGDGGPLDSTLFYVLYLYRKAFREFDLGYASALAWVLFVIILAVTALQFRLTRDKVHYS